MKITCFVIFAFFFTVSTASGQDGYKQNLLNLVTVNFPSKPEASELSGKKVFYLNNPDVSYVVVVQDLSQERNFSLNPNELDEFYEGNIKGALKTSKGELISKKIFEAGGFKGIDFVYKTPSNPKIPELSFNRILFLNDVVFSISALTHSENEIKTRAERDKFLNSLEITADKNTLKQGNAGGVSGDNSTAFRIGYVIGQTLVYALLIFAVIFVVRKLIKKKAA